VVSNAESCARYYRNGGAAKIRAKTAEYRARNQAYINKIKSVPCADCGGTFPPCAMQFDHIRGTKVAAVSVLAVRSITSIAKLDAEIAKCEVVCANCHAIRTEARRHSSTV
jgi:hypothetical protein